MKYIETRGFVLKYWFSTENELLNTIELIIKKRKEKKDKNLTDISK